MPLTVQDLAVALRITADPAAALEAAQESILSRLLGSSQAMVGVYASSGTPEAVTDQAAVLVAAYIWDQPPAGRGSSFASAWVSSGAQALCEPWRTRRAALLA